MEIFSESQIQQEVFGLIYKKKCGQCSVAELDCIFDELGNLSERIIFKMWLKMWFTLFKNTSVFFKNVTHIVTGSELFKSVINIMSRQLLFQPLRIPRSSVFFSDGTWQVLMKYRLPIAKPYNHRCFEEFWPEFWSENHPMLRKADSCRILIIIAD